MATVAIIGGGPAGLVMAKTLLHSYPSGTFDPTIFEKSSSIGGMWPLHPNMTGRLNPHMPTNGSRYLAAFSDLAWETLGPTSIVADREDRAAKDAYIPLFPKAWQVGQYLSRYAETYVPSSRIKLNCKVLDAQYLPSGRWQVKWNTTETKTFDYLVIASGFFASPRPSPFQPLYDIPIFHSSELPADLVQSLGQAGKIVVVGGGLSGAEAAASVASQVSSQKWSPNSSVSTPPLKVVHLARRPLWLIPHLLPGCFGSKATESSGHKSFFPADFCLFDISRRLPEPICPLVGPSQDGGARIIHSIYSGFIGSNQSDLGSLKIEDDDLDLPPYLGISESYDSFARSGDIEFIRGTLVGIEEGRSVRYRPATSSSVQKLDEVVCVVMANGYDCHPALEALSQETLSKLGFDSSSPSLPLELDQAYTFNPAIPTLGFVAYYQGPFWGIIEMQARSLAARWANKTEVEGLPDKTVVQAMRGNQHDPDRIQQFPMGDFTGIMETFARGLDIKRQSVKLPENRLGTVIPARYPGTSPSEQSKVTLASFQRDVIAMSGTRFAAKAIFRMMQGQWLISRRLESALSFCPSGNFTGRAWFHPRTPTDPLFDAEYLYIEEGDLATDDGQNFRGSRRYAYRYQEFCDTLSAWFVKLEDSKSVDYFFHQLVFEPRTETNVPNTFRAVSSHLCVEDLYKVTYGFVCHGINLVEFEIRYVVKGPHKDYTSLTKYTRS